MPFKLPYNVSGLDSLHMHHYQFPWYLGSLMLSILKDSWNSWQALVFFVCSILLKSDREKAYRWRRQFLPCPCDRIPFRVWLTDAFENDHFLSVTSVFRKYLLHAQIILEHGCSNLRLGQCCSSVKYSTANLGSRYLWVSEKAKPDFS